MLSLFDDQQIAAALAHHARASRRLRLAIPALLGDAELARRIERAAAKRPGVVRVLASPQSGRVLLEYAVDAPIVRELDRIARSARRAGRAAPPAAPPSHAWHAEPIEILESRLLTSVARGLDAGEAAARLERDGANLLVEDARPSRLALLGNQVTNLPTMLLLGSTFVSLLLGDVVEAGAILAVVVLNASIGYRVERRSEELLASWRAAEAGQVDVVRDGAIVSVPSSALVAGDVIAVRAGAVVAADARVVEARGLAADESALTGESEPVGKRACPVPIEAALADRASMLHRGTTVAAGHGRAVVVATGARTEIAQVQRLAAARRAPRGRLQRRLNALSSRLAWSGLGASVLSGVAALAWRRGPLEIVRDSVALGVAAIPEGLPVTATAALVRAMAQLRDRGVIVRRLGTAETLGSVTVACVDKTGTLTENRMRLEVVSLRDDAGGGPRRIEAAAIRFAPGTAPHGPLGALLVACVLNSDVAFQSGAELQLAGSATECALVEAARAAGLDVLALHARWPRRCLVERSEGVRHVVSEHRGVAFMKGAPEEVIARCGLDGPARAAALADNAALAGDGLRVLAVAWHPGRDDGASRWRYLGLVALRDPLRPGVVEAVRDAARAGIRTIMLTGDQPATATAIARQARLDGDVIEGRALPELLAAPDAAARLRRIAVIARVSPADKLAVVELLRAHGEVVAMAGDGINDAPALRAADVGIAVGARSSDLARQTADVVLEHADLRAILAAIAEGRAVQDNLRRSIRFQAAGNLGEILLVLGASLAGRRLISSMGILWINLLTDTLPGLALALAPSRDDLLARPPVPPDAPILDRADWRRVARDGALIAAASGVAALVGGPLAAFATIGAMQFGYAAACRAPDQPLRGTVATMIGGSAALHLAAIALPPLRGFLRMGGDVPRALATFAVALGAPLLAGARGSDSIIARPGLAFTRKEITP